ncbi:hypothetical protein CLV78_11426 [Aliiruegeria haliotis]|uniref:Uncharacterized protein n=1 Tax=Aliiruegeria haliotis TaxID=1280846 RepID=A0A2T0RGI8_9RHOB|nr:hypothetical protein [Aliiruegeria haliotis]PRY20241.1 hypothetical protein CLV78_11426 [Aliiruegeria haliotis]
MTHPIETSGEAVFNTLRNLVLKFSAQNETPIVPEVYLSWDIDNGDVSATIDARPGELIAIDSKVNGEPRWVTLNIGLGIARLTPGDVVTLIADLQSSEVANLPVFIRSGYDGYSKDVVLHSPLPSSEVAQVQTLMHTIRHYEVSERDEAYQTLIVELPKSDFQLALGDARLMLTPASYGLRSAPETLSSIAG